MDPRLARHIAACNNAMLPGDRLPLRIDAAQVGWVRPEVASALAAFPDIVTAGGTVTLTLPDALPGIGQALLAHGFGRYRGEAFDVRATADGPALATVDRGALPVLGLLAAGVHVNGLVRRADGLHLWVARRGDDRPLDPGKLDHVVAGGVPAGMTPLQTLVKEAAEEAGIPAALAAQAVHTGTVTYAMERPEGLRRDWLDCYDLDLPEEFVPRPTDGEVAGFELWPLPRVLARVRDTDDFKFNVNLVLLDLFRRFDLA